MDKIKGEGGGGGEGGFGCSEVEGWGEKADNWITIKIKTHTHTEKNRAHEWQLW